MKRPQRLFQLIQKYSQTYSIPSSADAQILISQPIFIHVDDQQEVQFHKQEDDSI